MIKIGKIIAQAIALQAKEEAPLEACGYLAGDGEKIVKIFPMTNIDKSSEHFSFDPKEQFKVVREVRQNGWEIIAVYHSHPESPARLSAEDIRLAHDPNIIYIIYSLYDNKFCAYRVEADKIKEEGIQLDV